MIHRRPCEDPSFRVPVVDCARRSSNTKTPPLHQFVSTGAGVSLYTFTRLTHAFRNTVDRGDERDLG